MEEKVLCGNVKIFCVINTTSYNKDGRYCVQVCNFDELFEKLCFSEVDKILINDMDVDDRLYSSNMFDCPYEGIHIIRIA